MGSSLASIPVATWVPVLFNEELQCLFVGEHHIWIQTEVVVACGILTAEIPNEIQNTGTAEKVLIILSRAEYSQWNTLNEYL